MGYPPGVALDLNFGCSQKFCQIASNQIKPKKKQSGTRKYTQENIKTIQYIHHLVKEKGMTLEGTKKQLLLKPKDDKKESILSKLESIKDSLEKLKIKL